MLNIFMLLIPLRESFGIFIKNIPFRLGELLMPIFIISLLLKKKKRTEIIETKDNKYIKMLIFALFMNLLLSIIVGFSNINSIDSTFFYKYIIRNALYFIFVLSANKNISKFSKVNFEKYIKYIVIIEAIFYVLQYFNIYIYFSTIIPYSIKRVNIFGSLIRYCGTASEPGYLAPILVLPLYYFSMKEKNKPMDYVYYIVTWILIVLTFSTFVYALSILIIVIKYFKIIKSFNLNRIIKNFCVFVFLTLFGIAVLSLFNTDKLVESKDMIENKIVNFIFDDSSSEDYSATSRKLNYQYALRMYDDSTLVSKIIGRGTGAYSFSVKNDRHYGTLYEEAEEASNLYYSTLVDRGIIGIFILLMEFYAILKLKVNTIESKTIAYALFTQMLQYYIVGNNWLYFFWLEVSLLIYYNRIYNLNR